ncbi:MAG: N-succinylarginine dihydrolase [Halobacteriovoraceae bacterium]|nr:N-succinylarginine dihydrolase [Halobacteriovoraceae bacterium]|tara:strand:+ start:522 stop:1862 length:1341 start_codon:yes stop_codon:yes gene_type:complete
MENYFEANFDGIVGPTHNYAGLSSGNVASLKNAGEVSKPKEAAKQGLAKAKSLADLGLVQGVLAPHMRPDLITLKRLGFTGKPSDIIEKAYKRAPEILAACYSCSPMWTANAATISPSPDTHDQKVHITPANLNNKFHRSIEPAMTAEILKKTFSDPNYFVHHQHLPEGGHFGDEGAANHTRFCTEYGDQGLEFFVFGKYGFDESKIAPTRFPARQTKEASQAIARLHGLNENKVVFSQQNPSTIDAGVFHNDVISVGNKNVYFYHEKALHEQDQAIAEIKSKFGEKPFYFIQVPESQVSVQDAVESYLFNSQLISLTPDSMAIVVPSECEENKNVQAYLKELVTMDNPINEVKVYDVKQSMKNGGGPACLRLRVCLSQQELTGVNQKTLLTDQSFSALNKWIDKHYRDEIRPSDIRDPNLMVECQNALDELSSLLGLGNIYPFQN